MFTIPFECCFSLPTRKRWCVCLHMTSQFYDIYIDSRNLALTFFSLGRKHTVYYYFTTISMNRSSKFSPFLLFSVINGVFPLSILRIMITPLVFSNSCSICIAYLSVCWHTWKTCCVCFHKTSRFYEIGIVVNDRNVVLKFLDLRTKIQYFIWSVQNNIVVLFLKVFYVPTNVVFTIILMLAPRHISLAWG